MTLDSVSRLTAERKLHHMGTPRGLVTHAGISSSVHQKITDAGYTHLLVFLFCFSWSLSRRVVSQNTSQRVSIPQGQNLHWFCSLRNSRFGGRLGLWKRPPPILTARTTLLFPKFLEHL